MTAVPDPSPTRADAGAALVERGVVVPGGIRATDPDALLEVLAEGGSGYHFLEKPARRVTSCPGRGAPRPENSP